MYESSGDEYYYNKTNWWKISWYAFWFGITIGCLILGWNDLTPDFKHILLKFIFYSTLIVGSILFILYWFWKAFLE